MQELYAAVTSARELYLTGYATYLEVITAQKNVLEAELALNEQKKNILKNVIVFDYYWRLMRNLKIDSEEKLLSYLGKIKPKPQIISIIHFQKKIPNSLLKIGVISKLFMLMSYCRMAISNL